MSGLTDTCRDCGYRLALVDDGWLAEDDSLGCSARGVAPQVYRHRPTTHRRGQHWAQANDPRIPYEDAPL